MRGRALVTASPFFAKSSRAMGRPKKPRATSSTTCNPHCCLWWALPGGLPSDDISLGDVVLSTRVLDFSLEARKFQEHTTYNVGGGPIFKSIATSCRHAL